MRVRMAVSSLLLLFCLFIDLIFNDLFILTRNIVVSLALICSFKKMREHLELGNVKAEEISEDTLDSVVQTLKKSTSLKLSDDGWSNFLVCFPLLVFERFEFEFCCFCCFSPLI